MNPPLSKFYHGPGWTSTESSPSHNGSTNSINNTHEFPPSLPPRLSSGPPIYHTPQSSQGWNSPAPSAPTASQLSMSNNYAVRPATNDNSVDSTWGSGSPKTSKWATNHKTKRPDVPNPITKPLLPPRPHQPPDHHPAHATRPQKARLSETTIDVPLFLQPVAYDPVSASSLPDHIYLPPPDGHDRACSLPEPQRLPPPPPRKIPLDKDEDSQVLSMIPKRPQYDPQHSYDGGQQQVSQRLQRPRFDPQNSHDALHSGSQWEYQEQQPTIAAPRFTSFSVESALPPIHSENEPSVSPQLKHPQPTSSHDSHNIDGYHASQDLHQSLISPLGYAGQARWTPTSKPWDPQVAYAASPERQHAVSLHPDEQSVATSERSSNAAGKSTPESQQTSNTSYRDPENQAGPGQHDERGDDSFYWHSGRSSSDPEEEHSQNNSPVPRPQRATVDQRSSTTESTVVTLEHKSHPTRSTSLSPSAPASYGASALGFGGPSDWEYFGDYEAEEIDDEDLYSRPRPRQSSSGIGGFTELPANTPLPNTSKQRGDLETSLSGSLSRKTSSPIEISFAKQLVVNDSGKDVAQNLEASGMNDNATTSNPAREQSVKVSHPSSGDHVSSSNLSPDQRPDMDEVIRAWSEAPFVGQDENKAKASIPSEAMRSDSIALGVTPSLTPVPIPIDHLKPLDDNPQRGSHSLMASFAVPYSPHDRGGQDSMTSPPEMANSIPGKVHDKSQYLPPIEDDSSVHHVNFDSEPHSIRQSLNTIIIPSDPYTTKLQASTITKSSSSHPESGTGSANVLPKCEDLLTHGGEQIVQPEEVEQWPSQERSQDAKGSTHGRDLQNTPQAEQHALLQEPAKNVGHEALQSFSSTGLEEKTLTDRTNTTSAVDSESVAISQEPWQIVDPALLEEPAYHGLRDTQKQDESFRQVETTTNLESPQGNWPGNTLNLQASVHVEPMSVESRARDSNECSIDKVVEAEIPKHSDASTKLGLRPPRLADTVLKDNTVIDPYADLDPWGKASLNRFAAMLREESRADTNKDKLNIFNVFTSRESRLRVVLYGTEDDLLISPKKAEQQQEQQRQKGTEEQEINISTETVKKREDSKPSETSGFVKQAVQRANTLTLQRSLKALPALPANRESVVALPGHALAPLVVNHSAHLGTEPERSIVESSPDSTQYSPGGRPLVRRLSRGIPQNGPGTSENVTNNPNTVAGANDTHKWSLETTTTQPSENTRPAYKAPKYNEPRSEVKNYLANRKSVNRPYATLTQGSLEGGSIFGRKSDTVEVPVPNSVTTAPRSQYNAGSKPEGDNDSDVSIKPNAQAIESQPDLRRFVKADFDPLLTILPESAAVVHTSARLSDLQNVLENVPDDFGFIHQSVVAWDAKAKKKREENDRQRHARQVESEQRIDSLFDDHEIGYGDISELESEFKRSEAARRADEDRSEYQVFVSDVFNLVWTRLHYELDQLIPHYEQYSKSMNDTLAGRDMFEGLSDGLALAPTMNSFLTLHQKLEIRHQKAFEAVLERDRRLKKTEISPWYTLSNITKVKQLERQFEDAEKKAIIEYCEQRNSRANNLMDVLDQNTLRGVGANQDYMEAIMKAVKRIASGRAFASVAGSNEPTAGMEEVEKAKTITTQLATSSEQIVQTFHVADMLLNSADYEVSVAKAKVAKADIGDLARLKEERAKEDQKLMRELEHRLALIREDTRRTKDEIVKLMLFLGVTNGQAIGAPVAQAEPADIRHEARIQKALEDAKKRNTLKESG